MKTRYFDKPSHRLVTFEGIRKNYFGGTIYTVRLRDVCGAFITREYRTMEEAEADVEKNLERR